MKRFAIIGFGAAGYNAAKEIRRRDNTAVIDVYSDSDTAPYNPMLTTYYVKGALPYEALFPFGDLESITKELRLRFFARTPVLSVVPQTRVLRLPDKDTEPYDGILIATGASALVPRLPGIDLPGVIKMRTLEDAVQMKKLLDSGTVRSALIIGASWVGVKVLEAFLEKGVSCTLIDGAARVFPTAAFAETSLRVQKDLENKGVQVFCAQMLERIEQTPDGRLCAFTQNGQRFSADTVAVCVGVRMNTEPVKDTGIAPGRGVRADKYMRTACEGIYAAGDCCEAPETVSGQPRNIGVWLNANVQGRIAGANMTGANEAFGTNVPVNLAHYLGFELLCLGDPGACSDTDEVYEYEDARRYIRAVKGGGAIKCINMTGPEEVSGLIKNAFIKSWENKAAGLDLKTVCCLQDKGIPDSFIEFLGGIGID